MIVIIVAVIVSCSGFIRLMGKTSGMRERRLDSLFGSLGCSGAAVIITGALFTYLIILILLYIPFLSVISNFSSLISNVSSLKSNFYDLFTSSISSISKLTQSVHIDYYCHMTTVSFPHRNVEFSAFPY